VKRDRDTWYIARHSCAPGGMGRCTTAYVERMTKAEAALRDLLVKLNVGPESDWEEVRETHGAQGGEVEGCGIRRKQRDAHLCLGSWMWAVHQQDNRLWLEIGTHLCGICAVECVRHPNSCPCFRVVCLQPALDTTYHVAHKQSHKTG
jgi:hypothetical protein